jgi:hypothetical protein
MFRHPRFAEQWPIPKATNQKARRGSNQYRQQICICHQYPFRHFAP